MCFEGLARLSRRVEFGCVLCADHVRFHSCRPYIVSTDALIVASNTCVLLSVHYKMESYCTFHTMNQSLQLVVNHYLCRYSVLLTRACLYV